jgi:uncharacterized damage-inducible protein DinB
MDPEVAVFWRYIASSLDRLVACAAALDEAELGWRPPAEGANSLRVLAVHTLANAEENLLGLLGVEDAGRDRDAELRAAAGDGPELERRWRSLRARIERALDGLDGGALERPYAHPRRRAVSGREVLIVVARHAAEHLGQAELTRDLLRRAQSSGSSASAST